MEPMQITPKKSAAPPLRLFMRRVDRIKAVTDESGCDLHFDSSIISSNTSVCSKDYYSEEISPIRSAKRAPTLLISPVAVTQVVVVTRAPLLPSLAESAPIAVAATTPIAAATTTLDAAAAPKSPPKDGNAAIAAMAQQQRVDAERKSQGGSVEKKKRIEEDELHLEENGGFRNFVSIFIISSGICRRLSLFKGHYMQAKKTKLMHQVHDRVQVKSHLFDGISIYVNGYTSEKQMNKRKTCFLCRLEPPALKLRELITENGGQFHHYRKRFITTYTIAVSLSDSRWNVLRPDETVLRPEWLMHSYAHFSCKFSFFTFVISLDWNDLRYCQSNIIDFKKRNKVSNAAIQCLQRQRSNRGQHGYVSNPTHIESASTKNTASETVSATYKGEELKRCRR